jgi:hypothetical protein
MFYLRADVEGQDDHIFWEERLEREAKADTVRILINNGADVTKQDQTGSTPLHMASSWGGAEIVQLLIEHGADVTVRNETHSTPLHSALSWVSATTASFWIYLGADVKWTENWWSLA